MYDTSESTTSPADHVNKTFWLFQTHLHDLSSEPTSNHFKTCRRIFNKVQRIVFGTHESLEPEKIKENVLPTTVLCSIVLASVAVPFLPREVGPLAVAQARKPRQTGESQLSNLSHPAAFESRISRISKGFPAFTVEMAEPMHVPNKAKLLTSGNVGLDETISEQPQVQRRPARSLTVSGGVPPSPVRSRTVAHHRSTSVALDQLNSDIKRSKSSKLPADRRLPSLKPQPLSRQLSSPVVDTWNPRYSTTSLPDFPRSSSPALSKVRPPLSAGAGGSFTGSLPNSLRRRQLSKTDPNGLSRSEQVHMLRSNYFRSQTSFLSALESISNRLVVVPKAARLSALRAELALIGRDLPAEVDIPLLCPATLDEGIPSRSRHHRVVRMSPAEATSLNSAERVPYLLMVEVLREDFDFNPDTEANQRLMSTLLYQKEFGTRRIFDITAAARASLEMAPEPGPDSVFEPATGDLSSPTLLKTLADIEPFRKENGRTPVSERNGHIDARILPARSSSGTHTVSSRSMLSTPRTSDIPNSRSSSPGPNKFRQVSGRNQAADPDFSALATHMRTAAQMLAQLDLSGSKRPRGEVEAIKSKIIASMQSLEEQNFNNEEDTDEAASFDTIMASATPDANGHTTPELHGLDDVVVNASAGAARMENDQKTGGVKRKGDRDDPSAATFGEEWKSKKERIRRSSPYGYMKNWDLLSVIVKTGSDLRQEMFACQLIRICSKIWEDARVPVWVKQMQILVTGESSGLIETITNGVSLHSLKRSLTLASIAAGTNPRKRFATLKDHFVRTFGDPDTPSYRNATDAFMRSLAAYSMLSYILQLKDRHNGNILVDNVGHIIHIDFGFMLSNTPGSVGFEAAPFKLTQDYVDVLGGATSTEFDVFKTLCKQAFQALRKSAENIISVVELMGKESKMACFAAGGNAYVTSSLRQRFCLHLSREEAEGFVDELVAKSLGSYYTRL